jgi:leucyl-tRNA synthetase
MGPLEATKPWSMQGVEGISRFLNRSWRMIIDEAADEIKLNSKISLKQVPADESQLRVLHKTIQSVTQDMESLSFNTAISRLMEFVNFFTNQKQRPLVCMETFVLLLSPMAPHIAEELWQALGHSESLAYAPWPACDKKYILESTLEIPIQINGKVRSRIKIAADAVKDEIEQAALEDPKVKKHLKDHTLRKVIIVPKKLINIVAS